jgi:hypothetical protein
LLKIIRRTGTLTESEKEQRRQATQAKHYSSHKEKILERSKKRREIVDDFVQRSQQLLVHAESSIKLRHNVREKVEDYGKELERIYGTPESFTIDVFMRDVKTPVSYGTFTMLLVYFMPPESLPTPFPSQINAKVIDFLPTDTHYRQLSKYLHPDRHPEFAEYSSLGNAGWQLCKKVLADPKLKDMLVPPNASCFPVQSAEYCGQGDIFTEVSRLYNAYLNCWCTASQALTTPKLTPYTLYRSLLATVESRKLLNASLDDEETGLRDLDNGIEDVIAEGKKFAALPRSRRKRNAQRERELDDEVEEEEVEEEEEDEDEDEDEDRVSSGRRSKRLRSEMIDPVLRATSRNSSLRSRRG